jgi:hypothetical protein
MRLEKLQTWFRHGGEMSQQRRETLVERPWYAVIWLTGVDYFSTLAYQAGIALIAAGLLAPLATAVLALVTLIGAVPIYMMVARRSYAGQGSIALLENLLSGWWGKLLILGLLGFAGTDFVITMTLSAADAARHATENAFLHPYLGDHAFSITIVLLLLLAAVFLAGFHEAITLAMVVGIPYILINTILLAKCAEVVMANPGLWHNWRDGLSHMGSLSHIVIASVVIFPGLALGLSGFETGVSVMPLIKGEGRDVKPPAQRIRNTHKLLLSAALLMCVLLMISSVTTTLLIAPDDYNDKGPANGRALAFLAYRYFGKGFGTVYDISTIAILWFAGASAMAGLLNLIPRYLPRFGMAPRWMAYSRPLVLILLLIDLAVTIFFDANVDRQSGAYATGVLVVILSAAIAAAIALARERRESATTTGIAVRGISWGAVYSWAIAIVFAYALVENVRERPDGIIIGSIFTVSLIIVCFISRYQRQGELRVRHITFFDRQSETLWEEIQTRHVNIVAVDSSSTIRFESQRDEITRHYRTEGPLAFIHVGLLDNRSNFYEAPMVRIQRMGEQDYTIQVKEATVIANTIVYIALVAKAQAIFLRLKGEPSLGQALRYFLFGTGSVGLRVHEILLSYCADKPETERPRLYLMTR